MKVLKVGELKYEFNSLEQVERVMPVVVDMARKGIRGGSFLVKLYRPSRTEKQNRWFHALIGDIARGVDLDERYSLRAWKALMVDEFELELASMGRKLPKPSEVVLSFDKKRAISLRASTTDFGKELAGEFITFLYSWGAQNGVNFSKEAQRIYREYGG